MRVVLFALVGLLLGVGAGGGFEGLRHKSRILELRADSLEQALADSALAATHAEGGEPDTASTEAEPPSPGEADEHDGEEGAHVTPDDSLAVPAPGEDGGDGSTPDPVDAGDDPAEAPSADDAAAHAQEAVPGDDPADTTTESPPDLATAELTPVEMAASAREAIGVPEALERLGKIFMAMKPRDAAAVLEHLNDQEVEAILFQLREKNAAQILGNFPPDRAAVLSRSVLQRSGSI
jgi:hypothetical protein